MEAIRFIDKDGTFSIKQPENYSAISITRDSICFTDAILVCASFPISAATTVNPFPASPARAASIAIVGVCE